MTVSVGTWTSRRRRSYWRWTSSIVADQERDDDDDQPCTEGELRDREDDRDEAGRAAPNPLMTELRRQPGVPPRNQCRTMPACDSVIEVKTPTA